MQTISLRLQHTKIITCFLNGRISDLLSVLPALGAGPGLGCEEHLLAAGGGRGGARHLPRLQPRVQDVQDHGSNHQVEAVHEGEQILPLCNYLHSTFLKLITLSILPYVERTCMGQILNIIVYP